LTNPFTNVCAVIFDLDGTLLSSNLDFVGMRNEIGCPYDQDILSFIATLSEPNQQAANRIVAFHELTDAKSASWIDGVEHCVTSLRRMQVPMAIVTRNSREAVALKISNNNVPIDHIVTREDGPPKPDPTTLINIARQWQIEVHQIAYVGDYLYDVQAANNAGMMSCLFASDGSPEYGHLADYIFSDFNEFLQNLKNTANFAQ
jgi:HAD superfamily hydrolase (TIGR01509 family)